MTDKQKSCIDWIEKMTGAVYEVGSVATDLQTIAHEGFSTNHLYIKILDSFYDVGNIKKILIQGEQPKEIFAIEAKCFNEE